MAAQQTYEAGPAFATPEAARWAERLDRYANPDTVERVWADLALAGPRYNRGDRLQGVRLVQRAVDLARRLDDPETFWASAQVFLAFAPIQYAGERLRLAQELTSKSRVGVSLRTLGETFWRMADAFLKAGQHRPAEAAVAELHAVAGRCKMGTLVIQAMAGDAILATFDGRLDEAAAGFQHILARGEELGIWLFASAFATSTALPANVHLGTVSPIIERYIKAVKDTHASAGRDMLLLFFLAHSGQYAELAEMLERLVVRKPGIGSDQYETDVNPDVVSLEVAVLAGHRRAAELLLAQLASCNDQTTGVFFPTCVARHLGGACALLERYEEARKYYQEAIKVCTEMRFRPELALSRLQLAELLLEHYPQEKSEAIAHLDFAIAALRDMKMQPSLERALRHKEILKS